MELINQSEKHTGPPIFLPEEFPIPDGTDPADCLLVLLDRANGVLGLLPDEEVSIGNETHKIGYAVETVVAMLKQCEALVHYWHEQDREKAESNQ